MDQALIERIVTDVLAQLQPKVAVRTETAAPTPIVAATVQLDVPVITAEILQDRINAGQTLRIGAKSLITPTARDWLHTHRIPWQRAGRTETATNGSAVKIRRQLLISTVTPVVRTVRETVIRELPGWKHELTGRAAEVATAAAHAINASEAELVVVISDAADVVACRANRQPRVRAAVVASPEHLRLLVEHLGPNVFAINPRGRSFIELRNLLRTIATLPVPCAPHGWG